MAGGPEPAASTVPLRSEAIRRAAHGAAAAVAINRAIGWRSGGYDRAPCPAALKAIPRSARRPSVARCAPGSGWCGCNKCLYRIDVDVAALVARYGPNCPCRNGAGGCVAPAAAPAIAISS
jgi:hypothetical protein